MKTKNYNNLDKEKYPILYKMFKELEETNECIHKKEFNKLCPGFIPELYNLTKERTSEIVLSINQPITKINSKEFLNEEFTKKGLEIYYSFDKEGINAYIGYNINRDIDGASNLKKFMEDTQSYDPDLDGEEIIGMYTEKRFEEIRWEASPQTLEVYFPEYEILFYLYLDSEYPRIGNESAHIDFYWDGEIIVQKDER